MSHDGKELKRLVGPESLEQVSKWLEEVLETIKPGSRPKGGIKLPEVGAHEITDHATETIASAVPISSTIVAKVASSKDAPNPLGKSKSLTAETFQQHVTTTLDPWFIKF